MDPEDMQARIDELEQERDDLQSKVDDLNDTLDALNKVLTDTEAKYEGLKGVADTTRDLVRAAAEAIEKADI